MRQTAAGRERCGVVRCKFFCAVPRHANSVGSGKITEFTLFTLFTFFYGFFWEDF
jgi:hypothetical protein